jgi:hypothetical protein
VIEGTSAVVDDLPNSHTGEGRENRYVFRGEGIGGQTPITLEDELGSEWVRVGIEGLAEFVPESIELLSGPVELERRVPHPVAGVTEAEHGAGGLG